MRRVPKDKRTGLPKKYLSGVKGAKRKQLARLTKRIARLYKEGKRIPRKLLRKKTNAV